MIGKEIGPDPVIDWFASRNRLLEDGLLPALMKRPEITDRAPEVFSDVHDDSCGFEMEDSFLFIAHLASKIHFGGAYRRGPGDGSSELQLASAVSEQMFQNRLGEISYYVSWKQWSRWYKGIAWDYTAAVFDRQNRNIWLLFVTDTD